MRELLLLKLRDAIASKEFFTAQANYELARYGSWQCDWWSAFRETNEDITAIIKEIESVE